MVRSTTAENIPFNLLVKKIILFIEVNFVLCTEIQKNRLWVDLCYYLQLMISSFVFVISIMISFSYLTFYYLRQLFHHIQRQESLVMRFQIQILLIYHYFFQVKFITAPYMLQFSSIHTTPWFYRSLKNTVLFMNQF